MSKMKIFKKIIAVGSVAVLIASSTIGCATSSSSTDSTASGTTSESSNVKYGKITAVDGSKITLDMGTMSQGGGMGGGGGSMSGASGTAPSGDMSGAPSGQAPSGTDSGNAPSGQAPSGNTSGDTSGKTPPSMPSGTDSGTAPSGQAPSGNTSGDMSGAPSGDFSGQAPSGNGGGMGGSFTSDGTTSTITISDESIISVEGAGTTSTGSLSDLAVGTILKLEYKSDGTTLKAVTVMKTGGMGGGKNADSNAGTTQSSATGTTQNGTTGGGTTASSASASSTTSASLTANTTVSGETKTLDGQNLLSATADENTLLVTSSGKATLTNSTLQKTGDTSSEDDSNFTGLNAVLCVQSGSSASVSDTTLTSAADGANGIFSTGTGAKVTASNVTINTTGNSSRGLDATYGGEITADKVKITTTGSHCAPIATDKGGGTVTVTNGILSASGEGSPCLYSTGTLTATNVTGTATGSQCLVVEGKNSVTLDKCDLTGAGDDGVMLYQSTSGDATEGTATLKATDSSLTTTSSGSMFYITNTQAEIDLTNTVLNFGGGVLINCAGNDTNNWGTTGSNGGTLTFKASNQTLKGDIECDAISSLSLSLTDGSKYTGAIDHINAGDCSISLSSDSTWTLTGDSYVTALTDEGTGCTNIISNGHTIYYDATNSANSWLNGGTVTLSGGGTITPAA